MAEEPEDNEGKMVRARAEYIRAVALLVGAFGGVLLPLVELIN